MTANLIVGIDPGVSTGFAIWSKKEQKMLDVATLSITEAMTRVRLMHEVGSLHSVVFEDARLRTGYFGERAAAKQQGAGSIKRDCSIWQEFVEGLIGVPLLPVSPRSKGAKVDAQRFATLSGWHGRTSEHGRDAGMLVLGR
jgi:hypothetical protein